MPDRYAEQSIAELKEKGRIPKHVAIIMDGNGRWAKKRNLPRIAGHRAGVKTVRMVVEECGNLGIDSLTLYTFSTENWSRPEKEVSALMKLLIQTLRKEIRDLVKNNVRLNVIGNIDGLPQKTAEGMRQGIETTGSNTGLKLNLALNYSGREEIINAVRLIAQLAAAGQIKPEDIDESVIEDNLYTRGLSDPDLLIRTSGEMRISNFLLWQLAYTELYITDVLWPDFSREDLYRAILTYSKRERRFGKVSEKIKE